MTEHQSQLLTVLFVDIAGSMELYTQYGNVRAGVMVGKCIQELENVVINHCGEVVKRLGDGLLCTFDKTESAFLATELIRDNHRDGEQLSVHAGLDFGYVYPDDDSIYGDAVNVAARMADIAKHGEIIATAEFVKNLPEKLSKRTRFVDKVLVKGKSTPLKIYIIVSEHDEALTEYWTRTEEKTIDSVGFELEYRGQVYVPETQSPQIVIGRLHTCDLVIDNDYTSRRHATIDIKRKRLFILDHSTNGTFVRKDNEKPQLLRRELVQLLGNGVISLGVSPEQDPEHLIHYRQLTT